MKISQDLKNLLIENIQNNQNLIKKEEKYWYKLNYPTYGSEEIISSLESLLSYSTTMGIKVRKFEEDFSSYIKSKNSIFVNSGSSADLLAIKSVLNSKHYDLKKGDKVLIGKWSGTEVTIDNTDYVIVKESDIMGIVS